MPTDTVLPTEVRPSSAPPPVLLSPAQRRVNREQVERITSARNKNAILGGNTLNRAAAAGVHFAKHAAPPRPSMHMKLWANPGISIGDLNNNHQRELLKWMNVTLKGTQLQIGKITAGFTSGAHGFSAGMLAKDIILVAEDIRKTGITFGAGELTKSTELFAG